MRDGLCLFFDGLVTDQAFGVLSWSFGLPAVREEVGAGPLRVRMSDADGRLWLRHGVGSDLRVFDDLVDVLVDG